MDSARLSTVPMQSVKLGGGALGFTFPKNQFILAGGGGEGEETLEGNQKQKRSHSGFSFCYPLSCCVYKEKHTSVVSSFEGPTRVMSEA